MTRDQFGAWVHTYFRSQAAAARALGVHPDTVASIIKGQRRDKAPAPEVSRTMELACAALAMGIDTYDGGLVTLGKKPH